MFPVRVGGPLFSLGLFVFFFDWFAVARREALLFGGRVAAARAPVRLARRGVSAGAEAGGSSSAAAAAQVIGQDEAVEWVKKDRRRMLHVVYRVGDLDKTIKYRKRKNKKKNYNPYSC